MTGESLDARWGHLIKRVQHELRIRMDAALAQAELTSSQYAALANLEAADRLSNAELARRSFVTPQTMIRIVTGLEERNLVTRAARQGNARVLDIELTATGRAALDSGHVIVRRIESEMAGRLTASQQSSLVEMLHSLLG